MTVDPQERSTWRSGVRSAMRAASQLPGKGPTDVDDAPAPHVNQKSDYDNWMVRNILVTKLSGFAQIFIYLTPAPEIPVWKTDTLRNVIIDMTSFAIMHSVICDLV